MRVTFRIDDVSVNTDVCKLSKILCLLDAHFENCAFILGVSPLVADMTATVGKAQERVYPEIFNALSDHTVFYRMQKLGIPSIVSTVQTEYPGQAIIAGHGLIHVDHRLLSYEVQELNIVTCCCLLDSEIFIPPFNKWNVHTEAVCKRHKLHLIKFEDGWRHFKFHPVELDKSTQYYFHTHDFDLEEFEKRLGLFKEVPG